MADDRGGAGAVLIGWRRSRERAEVGLLAPYQISDIALVGPGRVSLAWLPRDIAGTPEYHPNPTRHTAWHILARFSSKLHLRVLGKQCYQNGLPEKSSL